MNSRSLQLDVERWALNVGRLLRQFFGVRHLLSQTLSVGR